MGWQLKSTGKWTVKYLLQNCLIYTATKKCDMCVNQSYGCIPSYFQQLHIGLHSSTAQWTIWLTGCKNNLKHISTQEIRSLLTIAVKLLVSNLSCQCAMWQNNWLFKNYPLSDERNASSIKCMNSASHKIQWRHISSVVDKFKNTYAEFLRDATHQN